MPWSKWSDTASDHPSFARLYNLPYWEPSLRRELTGFIFHCATHSAQYFTDYYIEEGIVKREGGLEPDSAGIFQQNWERMADAALKVGFFTGLYKNKEGITAYKLIDDPENFVHLIRRDEAEWNKGRDRDLNDTVLKGKVRVRDGDQCRWCRLVVSFDTRNTGRAGTYDHVTSMVVADGDPSKMVVSCRACNLAKGNGKSWDKKLLPAPVNPYYSESTVKQLAQWGFHVQPTTPPLFDGEVDPAESSTPSVEPETVAPQVESDSATVPSASSGWSPVDPVAVEPAVETEKLAPVLAPAPTVPGVDPVEQQLRQFEEDIAEGEAPGLEPETVARPVEAPSADSARVLPDTCRNRQKRSLEGLEVPGRDGSGRAPSYTQVEAENTSEHGRGLSVPKKPRRRRRRKKSNAETKKG